VQIAAFLWVTRILRDPHPSTLAVFSMLAMCTSGFAFVTPSLNSLLSRRSDPAKQGAIFGLAQSINSLARILGAGLGIPLLMAWELLPYYLAAALMTIGLILVIIAARSGKDFPAEGKPAAMH
jgi:predicted MFS family arabinose efflux permease